MRLVAIVVSVLVLAVTGSAHGATQAACDAATATPLVQEPDRNPRIVAEVHCGAFLGPGSEAMVVVAATQGGCVRFSGWQVFARVNGGWQAAGTFNPTGDLRVEGTTVVERRAINRRGDWFACSPTGGVQERAWGFDGSAHLPGAWTQAEPAQPKGEVYFAPRDRTMSVGVQFHAALLPVLCQMVDGRRSFVSCEHLRAPFSTVRLTASGRVRICRGERCLTPGNPGVDDLEPPLRRDQSVAIGRFRCRAERANMRCVVIETGKGFVIGRRGPRAIR